MKKWMWVSRIWPISNRGRLISRLLKDRFAEDGGRFVDSVFSFQNRVHWWLIVVRKYYVRSNTVSNIWCLTLRWRIVSLAFWSMVSRKFNVTWNPDKCHIFESNGDKVETNVYSLNKCTSEEILRNSLQARTWI